jgi:hypothetical protein
VDRVTTLTRRPLLVLDEPGYVVEWISARQPHKADRVTNALRRIADKVDDGGRRFKKVAYNRRQRDLYHSRVPRAERMKRPGQEGTAKKRTAPDKRLGMKRRTR